MKLFPAIRYNLFFFKEKRKGFSLLSGLKTAEMNNPFQNKPWYKFVLNKYIVVLLFFVVWMVFLDNYSYLDHRLLNKEVNELEDNKTYYQHEIRKDKNQIKKFKNPAEIEKYAREKYFMKKDSEDIYIIEFEGDTIEKNK